MTVRVRDARVYSRILREGSVGLGESYADGWWDTDDLTGFLRLAHRSLARTHAARDRIHRWLRPVVDPVARRRRADKDRDARNVRAHYDLGNEFFQRILDETMMYSCAVFERPTDSLAEASVHKLDRLANLLALAARRSRARDRNRLGRLRRPRGDALRLPRDDDNDLATPVRVRATARQERGTRGPRDGTRATTTATSEGPSTRSSRSR